MSRKPFVRQKPRTWFMSRPFYMAYAFREATAVVIGLYFVNLVCGLYALSRGADPWQNWVDAQASPLISMLALATLLCGLYHSYTWFNATPKVTPIQLGEKKLPAEWISRAHWAALAVITLVFILIAWSGSHGGH